jgi:biotin carboxyl carrier protein
MRYTATLGERTATIEVAENGHARPVNFDGTTLAVDWQAVGGALLRQLPGAPAGHYSLLVGQRSYEVYVRTASQDDSSGATAITLEVSLDGRPYRVRLEDERTRALAGLAGAAHERGDVAVEAPMPGLVANVMVAVGDAVERGQTVIVLEAMKMENDLTSPRSGIVRALHVSKGQPVSQYDKLFVIGDPGAPAIPAADSEDDIEGA